jgi:cell division protein FtsI/penicillin-binding protein 2
MADMARRGAHSARHRAGRTQPDAGTDVRTTDGERFDSAPVEQAQYEPDQYEYGGHEEHESESARNGSAKFDPQRGYPAEPVPFDPELKEAGRFGEPGEFEPRQYEPDRFDPAQPGPIQAGPSLAPPTGVDPARLGPAEFRSRELGPARIGPRPHGPVRLRPQSFDGPRRTGTRIQQPVRMKPTGNSWRRPPASLTRVPPALRRLAPGLRGAEAASGQRQSGQSGPPGRPRKKIFKSRSTMIRLGSLVCAGLVVIIAGVTGVGQSDPSVTASVKAFLLAWQNHDYSAAAALTTGQPLIVKSTLQNAYSQLGAADLSLGMGPIQVHGDTAVAHFNAEVDLGRGGRPWNYEGRFTLLRHGSQWLVAWSPSVIVPGLGVGDRLAVLTKVPERAPLLDSSGQPLIYRSEAVEVGVRPDRVKHKRATALKLAKATGLASSEADQMVGQIKAAPPTRFLELVQLSPRRFAHLSRELGRVPNLTHVVVTKRLFKSAVPDITGQIGTEATKELIEGGAPYRPGTTVGLSGLQQTYQTVLAGTPTTTVVVQRTKGDPPKILKSWQGRSGTPVKTTIDLRVQQAAQRALSGLGLSGAVVAVQASTGKILAVAERQADGLPDVDPIGGRYQPGQAFGIVPTAAALSKPGALYADKGIPCNKHILGVVNDPPVPKSQPARFSYDFAHACSTGFAQLSYLLNGTELQTAAQQFGIGVPWRLPLRPDPFIGSIEKPGNLTQTAADVVGAGSVLVSPLDMALAAGVVDSGSWHRPSIVTSPTGPTLTSGEKVPVKFKTHVISQLQQLMAGTVSTGVARAARLSGSTLYGEVGTAPLPGHPKLKAVWFIGFRGGVAFAVLAVAPSAVYDPAVQIAHSFAERLPAGS